MRLYFVLPQAFTLDYYPTQERAKRYSGIYCGVEDFRTMLFRVLEGVGLNNNDFLFNNGVAAPHPKLRSDDDLIHINNVKKYSLRLVSTSFDGLMRLTEEVGVPFDKHKVRPP